MAIKIALILSVLLQFGAAVIAITLVKRTINNIAWWLISFGFVLMAVRRVIDILNSLPTCWVRGQEYLFHWLCS